MPFQLGAYDRGAFDLDSLQWMLCLKIVVLVSRRNICKCRFPSEYHRRAVATLELVMVKRGELDVQIWMSF